MSVTTRDQHDQVRRQLADLRRERAEQRDAIARLRAQAVENPTQEMSRLVAQAANSADQLDAQIEELRDREAAILRQLGSGGSSGALSGSLADQLLLQADELRQIGQSNQRFGERRLATIDREVVAGWFGRSLAQTPGVTEPSPGMTRPDYRGVIATPEPPTGFLDLVPSGTTDASTIEYAAEIRTGDSDVDVVEVGAIKSEVGLEWEDKTTATTTVAGWTKLNRNSVSDVAGLQQLVQGALPQRLRRKVENLILTGDGETSDRPGVPGIVGLLKTGGVASIPAAAGELLDRILDAAVAVMASGGTPNVCALALADWGDLMRLRGDDGHFIFPPATLQQQAWRLTLTPTVALPAGTAVVADSRAMQLLIRQPAQIRVSDSDQDDFVRNRLTVLAEMRAAFVVWQPSLIALIESE